jgi:hypothetical protein
VARHRRSMTYSVMTVGRTGAISSTTRRRSIT